MSRLTYNQRFILSIPRTYRAEFCRFHWAIEFFMIIDEVIVPTLLITFDDNSEHRLHIIPHTVEGCSAEVKALTHLRLFPFLAKLIKGDLACFMNGADQPCTLK